MISINVISSRKVISRCQEDSAEFTTQQSQFPSYCPDGPKESFGCPSVFGEVSKHLSRHQSQGTHVCIDVRTAQRTTTLETSVCTSVQTANWRLGTVNIACNRLDAKATLAGLNDWRLMKKHMRWRDLKSVAACRSDAHCLSLDAA